MISLLQRVLEEYDSGWRRLSGSQDKLMRDIRGLLANNRKSIPLQIEKENGKDAVVNRELFESIRKNDHLRYIEQDEAIKVLRRDNVNLKAELAIIKICRYCEHGYWANGHSNKPDKFTCDLHKREEAETNTCEKWEIWE